MNLFLELLSLLVFTNAFISFFPELRANSWAVKLNKLVEIPLAPIREMLPKNMILDPSPMILIMMIQMLKILF
jgi:uncharacterized protein YggT (Ycf19 family)